MAAVHMDKQHARLWQDDLHADVAAAEAVGDKAHNQIFQDGTESGHANYKPVGKGNVPVDAVKADDMLKR